MLSSHILMILTVCWMGVITVEWITVLFVVYDSRLKRFACSSMGGCDFWLLQSQMGTSHLPPLQGADGCTAGAQNTAIVLLKDTSAGSFCFDWAIEPDWAWWQPASQNTFAVRLNKTQGICSTAKRAVLVSVEFNFEGNKRETSEYYVCID